MPEASLEGQRKRNVPRPGALSSPEPSRRRLANRQRAERAAAIATLSAGGTRDTSSRHWLAERGAECDRCELGAAPRRDNQLTGRPRFACRSLLIAG